MKEILIIVLDPCQCILNFIDTKYLYLGAKESMITKTEIISDKYYHYLLDEISISITNLINFVSLKKE